MKINRENYEIYFIDYFDGKLNPAETAEFMLFLEENLDLKEEFEEFENLSLPEEEVVFPGKDLLKKKEIIAHGNILAENYESFFIAYHEGDLTESESSRLQVFLSLNPFLQSDFEDYGKAFLKPDESIQYPAKRTLKKYPFAPGKITFWTSAAAALILILLGSYFFFIQEIPVDTFQKSPAIVKLEKNVSNNSVQNSNEIISPSEINHRTEISEISNPVIMPEKPEAFTMRARLINEPLEDKSINGLVPRMLYQRFDNSIRIAGFDQYYAEESKEKTLVGKVIGNAFNSITSVFINNVDELELDRVSKINIWDIAEAGIAGYNTLADRDVIMVRSTDEQGNLKSVAVLGDNINYQKNFTK